MSATPAPSAASTESAWTSAAIPDQSGRVAVVTGANTGLGFETARLLAEHGATVVLACRSAERAGAAAARIKGDVSTVSLDLASLKSVRAAAEELSGRHPRIDLLVNNAGVMETPYSTTVDGFERQLGTNHLGHFALTGLLLPTLIPVTGSRIVTVSSVAHRRGRMDFADLGYTSGYTPSSAYGRSKLANLLFAFELQRRLTAAGAPTVSLAAHPGLARSELTRYGGILTRSVYVLLNPFLFQSAERGALPTLRAATDPAAHGGEFYGPSGRSEFKGAPILVDAVPAAHDAETQQRLWAESERLTGVIPAV